jgi:uroporphyrinogen-III synthase
VKKVLSTKKLAHAQKELLLNTGISLVEYNAISVSPLVFEVPDKIKYGIFTSGNSVDILFGKSCKHPKIEKVLCVGEKTNQKLIDFGQNVIKVAQNASELGDFILKSFKNEDFYFFCGTLRRDVLIDKIQNSKNRLFELKTYKTHLNIKKFDQKFDGIMFFSPSGVLSFTAENDLAHSNAFCIGETTASEAKKHTDQLFISNNNSIESVIAKTAKILREND